MVARIGPQKPFRIFLADWRDRARLSQQQLADRVETTKATTSRWETGERDPPAKALAALAYALNIEIEQLFHSPDRPSADDLLAGVSDATRRKAVALVKTLVDEEKSEGTNG